MKFGIYGIILVLLLAACGGEQGATPEIAVEKDSDKGAETKVPAPVVIEETSVVEYQKEVKAKMKSSTRDSMVRSYGVSEEQADCLLESLRTAELMRAQSDPKVQTKIEECGVDPAVVR